MRVCVFATDVGVLATRKQSLADKVIELTGVRADELCFVGCRQSRTMDEDTVAYLPYVDSGAYSRARFANMFLRLADARVAAQSMSRVGLSLAGPMLTEVILASEPDAVLLDCEWAPEFRAILQAQFLGPIYQFDERPPAPRRDLQWGAIDPSLKVSIVLPTHNGSKHLRQSIQSCLYQSYRHLELIVVDDGSAEDIRGIVNEFTDPRVTYVRHDRNRGLPAALNTGFDAASGRYLTWTSDDNYYAPDAIERLLRFLVRFPQVSFAYSSMYIVNDTQHGQPIRVRRSLPPADLKRQNSVGACFLYTREVYEQVGGYDSNALLVEDYDYWLRVFKRFSMHRVLAPLYYYRYHDESLTAKHGPEDVARRFDMVRRQNGIA